VDVLVQSTSARPECSWLTSTATRARRAPRASDRCRARRAPGLRRLAGCWTHWGRATVTSTPTRRRRLPRRARLHARRPDRGAELAPVVQHRPPLGLRHHRPGPGHWYADPRPARSTKSEKRLRAAAAHACFIQSIADDLRQRGASMDLWTREARLFKYGSGTGTKLLQPAREGAAVGGGKSSGLMSFFKIGDARPAPSVRRHDRRAQDGLPSPRPSGHRRTSSPGRLWRSGKWRPWSPEVAAALSDHLQEIMDACLRRRRPAGRRRSRDQRQAAGQHRHARSSAWPDGSIKRVLQLAEQGVPRVPGRGVRQPDWDSDAYFTVSGQNANNSVRVRTPSSDALDVAPHGS